LPETQLAWSAGECIGDYQILGVIGSGGMGVVYKALDRKLERTVALKFLPHNAKVGSKEAERFRQEAKAASGLDHTNIGVIHGLDKTADGQFFIVMAYYEGQTLTEKMDKGPLPLGQCVDYATQIARGLAEAHSHNIVHRDVKPSNVIVTSQGVVKIVDFGLAFVVSDETVTRSLGIAGTVAYMSPEQALGRMLDQRSDIWSWGIVLAQMLTGRHSFQRDTLSGVLLAIMNDPPQPLDGVPPELQAIIFHALAKDPLKRYQNCQDVLSDLARLKTAESAPTQTLSPRAISKLMREASTPTWAAAAPEPRKWPWIVAVACVVVAGLLFAIRPVRDRVTSLFAGDTEKHIAVLPFENIGNNPANEVLAEGLMESLTGRLSNLDVGKQSLWVVPASLVRARKVTDPVSARGILGATLVVQGSIQRDGQDVRLNVNLIDAKTLRQIGSIPIEDRGGDLSAVQDQAVSRLAGLMHIEVTPEMLRNTGGHVTPAASEYYLTALGLMQRYDKPGNLDQAITDLDNAVKADPQFALGFGESCEAYRLKFRLDQNSHWLDEALANCKRASQLDDRLPMVHVTLGRVQADLGKSDLALQEFNRTLELNPRDADGLMGLANAYEKMGRIADAEGAFQRAAALRPDYWDGWNSLGVFYHRQKRYKDAIAQFQRVIELTPDNANAYSNLGIEYQNLQQYAEAETAYKKSIALAPGYASYTNLGALYIRQGRWAESAAVTEKALQLNDKDFRAWANLALAYRWMKQDDKALAAREKEGERLEALVKVQPTDATLQSALGIVYAERKMKDKALTRIQASLQLLPDDGNILANAGEAYEDLGDRAAALKYVERAIQKGYTLDHLKQNPALQNLLVDPNFRSNGK
jgi:tetratricopeptide (TPR) repeat protein/TolB-like protein